MSADWSALLTAIQLDHGQEMSVELEEGIHAARRSAHTIVDTAMREPDRFRPALIDALVAVLALDHIHVQLASHSPADLERVIDAVLQVATAAASSSISELSRALEPSRIY